MFLLKTVISMFAVSNMLHIVGCNKHKYTVICIVRQLIVATSERDRCFHVIKTYKLHLHLQLQLII